MSLPDLQFELRQTRFWLPARKEHLVSTIACCTSSSLLRAKSSRKTTRLIYLFAIKPIQPHSTSIQWIFCRRKWCWRSTEILPTQHSLCSIAMKGGQHHRLTLIFSPIFVRLISSAFKMNIDSLNCPGGRSEQELFRWKAIRIQSNNHIPHMALVEKTVHAIRLYEIAPFRERGRNEKDVETSLLGM